MMIQYMSIREKYPDCLLFFRLGDFYEMFLDDAKLGAEILDITLTSRSRGKDGRIPMAGVPYHAVDSYLAKLVKAGYKVAICEQTSDPSESQGLVDREVVRIVTPGTVLDETSLDRKTNNYIAALTTNEKGLGLALADISTGTFYTDQFDPQNLRQVIINEFSKYRPTECILPDNLYNDPSLLRLLKTFRNLNVFPFSDWELFTTDPELNLKTHFNLETLHTFNLTEKPQAQEVAAALLGYLKSTQKGDIPHIKGIEALATSSFVGLDRSTIANLEIFSTLHTGDKEGSFLNVLDKTCTAFGGRLLKDWILHPLIDPQKITQRYDAVETFMSTPQLKKNLRETLKKINDIERILSRLSVGVGNARDLINLKAGIVESLEVREVLLENSAPLIKRLTESVSLEELDEVVSKISSSIVEEPSLDLKNGGFICEKVHEELDSLRGKVHGSKDWIAKLEIKEREMTGIASLKVRFNQVFGYYIEVTKANLDQVPDNYIRKQTLVNSERFITPELKEHEDIILTAKEKADVLEYEIFLGVVDFVLERTVEIQRLAKVIATIDCLVNFAHVAELGRYRRPTLVEDGRIEISEGRHPVVEKFLRDKPFVPNDTLLDCKGHQLLILTGPNMSGKSVYIRQVAVIVLMAQIGCFVPAASAEISLVDRIFVRSGASDVISEGLSTFMLEMVETAYILNNATGKSLVVMDEIGRGTSTYDGISIAWAVAEYLVNKVGAKTLFATHYHELQALEEKHPEKIKNYQVLVKETDGEPVFLHTVVPGGASHSYGIAVAKLAGVPDVVSTRAQEILSGFEVRSFEDWLGLSDVDVADVDLRGGDHAPSPNPIIEKLQELDLNNTTPVEALSILLELQKEL